MRHPLMLALAAAALCGAGGPAAYAVGMRVSPGGALIQGVEPGQEAELAVPITVMNDDEEPKTIVFAPIAPLREKMKVPQGYADLPDLSWVRFTKSEIEVPAKGHAAVKMVLNIPDGREYHNQHWSVAVAVRTKAVAGQMLTLGLYPRFEIETSPARVKGGLFRRPRPPAGDLAVTPSVETLEAVAPGGGARRVALALWNNTAKPFRGEVRVLTADEARQARMDPSGGWAWLPDPAWVKPGSAAVEVGPNASAELELDVAVPPGRERHGNSWEAIVLVRGDDGRAAFARLRVRTAPAATPH
ncbi:MAG TPA: hypothetical protein P5118_22100 [Planctomycetota bacterium]|nr:hypothetical protein [Planctomycetota bacterium]